MINRHSVFCFFASVIILINLTSCTATQTPTSISTIPTTEFTSTPIIQYSATPASKWSAFPVLSPENAVNTTEVARLTKGTVEHELWSLNGKRIIVSTTVGVYIYDAANGEEIFYLE